VIAEIRLRDGTSIYRATPRRRRVLTEGIPAELGQILRGVVTHGTGRRAASAFPDVPVAGKTGTTNSFRNAAFAGVVPAVIEGGWSLDEGMVVASYVGFDDNSKMSRGSIRLAGATGSLPAWIGAAEGVLLAAPGERPEDPTLAIPDGARAVQVESDTGLPIEGDETGVPLYPTASGGRFAPFEFARW
jgi:membrane peptidoglycan carboxypeptidase